MKFRKLLCLMSFFAFLICFETLEVSAGGGITNDGYDLTYRVDSILITDGMLDIKGWAYEKSRLFDYNIKGDSLNQHDYNLIVVGTRYSDIGDYYIDHTELNWTIGITNTEFKNVGFHFRVDVEDLLKSGIDELTLCLELYHQNRIADTISLSYLSNVDQYTKDGFVLDFNTDVNPVSIYTSSNSLMVNKEPYKGGGTFTDRYGRILYFTTNDTFSISDNTMTGNIIYDDVSNVYWYEIKFSESAYDGTRMRVVADANGTIGWISDAHIKYAGKPTVISLNRLGYTISYETYSNTLIDSQNKQYNEGIELSGIIPEKSGYIFNHWNTLSNENGDSYYPGNIYEDNKSTILYAIYTNEFPEIIGPIIEEDNSPFLDGENIVIQLGDEFKPLDYFEAYDNEDGDITHKIIIENNSIPTDANGKTTQSGIFEVEVSVRDEGGNKTSKVITVLVNEPPIIDANDRWFVEGWVVDEMNLLSKVKCFDKEDGDLSNDIVILYIIYSDGYVDFSPSFFNTSILNNSLTDSAVIYYKVIDCYGIETIESANLNIYRDYALIEEGQTIRFIEFDFLYTLIENSIWIINDDYNESLMNSFNRMNPLITYKYSTDQIEEHSIWMKNTIPDRQSNLVYKELYLNGY